MIKIASTPQTNDLLEQVTEISGENIFACYQCGTCSSGCPFIETMDIHPHMVLRTIMFGLTDVLESNTIWLCASCFMCAERCPRDIDMARVMESLRQIKLRENKDHTDISQIPIEDLEGVPQIALVSHFRKTTS
jgi:heterodisulfide reductase subunit C